MAGVEMLKLMTLVSNPQSGSRESSAQMRNLMRSQSRFRMSFLK